MTAIMVAMAAPLASAARLGAGGGGAVLGQWLDFAVQLHLDPAEDLTPECVNAEVTVGERRLPPTLVRTVLEAQGAGSARVRVITLQAIDEPVVGVNLSVGCQARLSRNYIVLADPPGMALLATAAVVAAPAFARAPADADVATALSPAAAPVQAATQRPASDITAVVNLAAGTISAAPAPARLAAPRATPAAVLRHAARPQRPARQRPTASRPRAATLVPVRGAVAAEAPARLKLDVAAATPSVEAAAVELALEAVAQAAGAVRASAAAASAAAARMAALERTAAGLGKEAQASRDEAAQLREQLSRADGGGRWMWPLLALVVLLAALTAWLAWRLSGLQRQRQRGWIEATAQAWHANSQAQPTPSRPPTSPIPFVTSEVHVSAPAAPGPSRRGVAAWPPAAPPETWTAPGVSSQPPEPVEPPPDPATMRTEAMPPAVRLGDTSPRDVSIDELIDLEQQAEFFVVLGQDEAAIDLLVQHLRDTGGGSPLPYLKLLEIQHRRGDRDAYERTRARFNHRFNAYAPEWGQDMRAGRSLEDYAGVLPRLKQVWPRPLDAMAELEVLLFRRSRGELFDLPAYREVLFLYALARDLLDREPVDPNNVDLLLPLADGGELSTTAPAPLAGLRHDRAAADPGPDDRPTAPVDLDLTQAAPTTSIFDRQDMPLPGSRP